MAATRVNERDRHKLLAFSPAARPCALLTRLIPPQTMPPKRRTSLRLSAGYRYCHVANAAQFVL
jgi:hypothetical protein